MDRGDEWLAAVRDVLDDNRRRLSALLGAHLPAFATASRRRRTSPGSTAARSGSATTRRRRSAGAASSSLPVARFGSIGAGFVRLNFATSPAVLEAIVGRMARMQCHRVGS